MYSMLKVKKKNYGILQITNGRNLLRKNNKKVYINGSQTSVGLSLKKCYLF